MSDPAFERLMMRVDRALAAEIAADEQREMEAHLEECLACAREIEKVRILRALLQQSCPSPAPRTLKERIRTQAREYSSYSEVRVTVTENGISRSVTRTEYREGFHIEP